MAVTTPLKKSPSLIEWMILQDKLVKFKKIISFSKVLKKLLLSLNKMTH